MSRTVLLPPPSQPSPDGKLLGGWWHDAPDGERIICDLCPRACALKPGDRGFCFVRQNVDGEMLLTTYGRSTGFCIDPIEKKPLNHFYPGSSVLSFGTAGCNLGCKFCQNWDISKSREVERLSELATPEAIAAAARQMNCRSVAFTYNDPVIWAEYAIDTAKACHAVGVKTVAVTAGYITPEARGPFYEVMDAANVDLKGFTEEFYFHETYSHLQPVLDTLEWLKKETNVWFEITNLIIPQANDSLDEIRQMCDWILERVGDEVPLHFSAFHPDFRMRDRPPTPHQTLLAAYDVARRAGVKYVYVGNVNDVTHQSTYCPHCHGLLVQRDWYALGEYHLRGDRCGHCGGQIAGHFDVSPGDWGRKRVPVQISRYLAATSPAPRVATPVADPTPVVSISPPGTAMNSSATSSPTAPQPAANAQRPALSAAQQKLIEHAANEMIAANILERRVKLADPTLGGAAQIEVMGAFVTLKRQGRLRACCGFLGQPMTLLEALSNAARRTALEDTRFPPISATELPFLELDISLLYGFQPLSARGRDRIAAVKVGQHGLTIRRGNASGLLLPQVPVENNWDAETFLRQVCRKANLPTNAWEDDQTQLVTYEAFCVDSHFDASVLAPGDAESPVRFTAEEIRLLTAHCRGNVRALTQGATPNYYLLGVSDGTVSGVTISLQLPQGEPIHVAQLALRPGVPLQTTAFQLSEAAANTLRAARISLENLRQLQVAVTVLYDPAMHGSVAEPDLRGIDPARRALMVAEGGKSAWVFDPAKTPAELLQDVIAAGQISNPAAASLFSLAAQTSAPRVVFSNLPRPVAGPETRPAAVAGTFYPGDAAELSQMVRELLAATPRRPESWPAVMVPHAGLRYSGGIAAAVLNQIEIPDTVIVIGPKHTRNGVEWAVAPHRRWSIPGATLEADTDLAQKLVAAIPGLQFDAAAHQQEHGIEVELPFLAQLAPHARVVGITIGGGGLERCQQFATGLASVIRQLPKRPLLMISSDMNHYAPDAENRRLDELALQALEKLDPAQLLATVQEHNISMCGVLPAVIVMETLRQLGQLKKSRRVAYATSADASGDTSRVVGYAGMLLE